MTPSAPESAHELVDRWEQPDTRLPAVVTAVEALRSSSEMPAARAAVANLVILTAAEAGAHRAVESIIHLGAHHPGRILVLVPHHDGGPEHLGARVDLYRTDTDGRSIWWDLVRLDAGARLSAHAESLVEPLLLHDLRVSLWLAGGASQADSDALIGLADHLIVSGERAAAAAPREVGRHLGELCRRRPLSDLAWMALEPSREALARLFDDPGRRARLEGARHLRVSGPPWSSRLLAGWLVERLGLAESAVDLAIAEELDVQLDLGGPVARLAAGPVWPAGHDAEGHGRGTEPGAAVADMDGGRVTVPHSGSGTPRLLTMALSQPWRDLRYEAALSPAGRLLP